MLVAVICAPASQRLHQHHHLGLNINIIIIINGNICINVNMNVSININMKIISTSLMCANTQYNVIDVIKNF